METSTINLTEDRENKKETRKLNEPVSGVAYSEEPAEKDSKGTKYGTIGRTLATGALGAAVGSGTVMASEALTGSEAVHDNQPSESSIQESPEVSAMPEHSMSDATPEPAIVEPMPQDPSAQEPVPPDPNPVISEEEIDPNDLDGTGMMNVERTGVVELDGNEYNAALVTDEAGNEYYLVDVDGEVGDPNATYDLVIDSTGEYAPIPDGLSVEDAQMMADNGIGYVNPLAGDSNNIAQDSMEEDIHDLAEASDPTTAETINPEDDIYDPLADMNDEYSMGIEDVDLAL